MISIPHHGEKIPENMKAMIMALSFNFPAKALVRLPKVIVSSSTSSSSASHSSQTMKRCLRCSTLYLDSDNSPTACSFHGHTNGEKGLFALAPPHQGIDGEWTDRSGVIVYKWNDKDKRPNTGPSNWKRRWSCCSDYDEHAPPCRRGFHVSYDDGFTLY